MYIGKRTSGIIILFAGMVLLTVLAVLYCFTDLDIPSWCYGAGWIGCLCAMVRCTKRISV